MPVDREQLRAEYEGLNTEHLVHMVAVAADDYHEDAIATAIDVLKARGVEVARAAPEGAESKEARAADLEYSGRIRIIWGGAIGAAGIAMSIASEGTMVFVGLALFGTSLFVSGLSLKGKGERLQKEVEVIRTNEREAVEGALSESGAGGELGPAEDGTGDEVTAP